MPEEIEAPTEHLHEALQEGAEQEGERGRAGGGGGGGGPSWIARAALSSALIAVLAAVSALLAGHHANEAILEQMKATDNWALYQAKGIKLNLLQTKVELLAAIDKTARPEDLTKTDKYRDQQKELEDKGHELERSSEAHMGHHTVLARAVTTFQVAIAMAAIAVLSRKKQLWYLSLALGLVASAFLVQGVM